MINPGGQNADDVALTSEDRAAIRAFLRRCDVRLSTIHRVATALLSGAGLLVLLPAVERDSVVVVLRALLSGRSDTAHLLLVVAVAASLAVPFTALWLVVRDLTQFYFHANHIRRGDVEAFAPRFTLTGLQLPRDELTPAAAVALEELRNSPQAVEILVPKNDATEGDGARSAALFELAASRERSLLDEVTKVEHGMTRHILRMQVIVLRYAKALLALVDHGVLRVRVRGGRQRQGDPGSGRRGVARGDLRRVGAPRHRRRDLAGALARGATPQ